MSNLEILSFTDGAALAEAAATRWLAELTDWPTNSPNRCVALAGGRITQVFFTAVTQLVRSSPGWPADMHFFWGDERCVPPTDAESNFAVANEFLLQSIGVPETRIHRLRGEERPEFAAVQAEAELRRFAPLNAVGQPVFDLILLGMGEDGHVASLFPGEPEATMASPAVYRAVTAVKPPPQRITLGYAAVAAARQVWVLASGPGKAAALDESLKTEGTTPLARVIQLRDKTVIFTDLKTSIGGQVPFGS